MMRKSVASMTVMVTMGYKMPVSRALAVLRTSFPVLVASSRNFLGSAGDVVAAVPQYVPVPTYGMMCN
jgi:hypothetical protein